ncbi:MAG TPA: glycosyltransferase [Pyrinomonadaceae bacterium]|nr:glycosyltransferase [Pyrinomonadaceae bacterium]
MKKAFLSVVIPTLNRRRYVMQCLREVVGQAREFSDVEIIVVDNASTDDTKEAVAAFINEISPLNVICRYVYEPDKGSNRTRNRGCAAAVGEAIALLDDDAVPHPRWVALLREHFINRKSDCVAGRVELALEAELPEWFPDNPDLLEIFGKSVHWGNETRFLKKGDRYPQSNNCAFTAEVFKALGGFNPDSLIYGDETEFFRRAGAMNFSFMYRHDIVVDHYVPPARLTKEGLYKKGRLWGSGAAFYWLINSPPPTASERVKRVLEFAARTFYVGCRWCMSPRFDRAYTFNFNRGQLKQLIKGREK